MLRIAKKSLAYLTNETKKNNRQIVGHNQRGQFRAPLQLKVGQLINDFEVTNHFHLNDFEINAFVLKCRKYGTQWIHFDCQQQINTIAFIAKCKDTPEALKMSIQKYLQCGSKKYPVRNPIQFMNHRSFNPQNYTQSTSDYIQYAYQTSILKDHYNLMDVFLQMMFNPLLRKEDFDQTVWRYSLQSNKTIQVNGNVANQVKALWNYTQMRIYDAIQRNLQRKQGLTKNADITLIKHFDIVQEHRRIFNPSNMIILTHGDIHPTPLIQKYSKFINQLCLQQNQIKQDKKMNKNQQNIQSIKTNQLQTIKVEQMDRNVPFVISYKLQNVKLQDRIALSILSRLLFDMQESPFMKWNTPQTPYPKHYGFQGKYFNIGVTTLQQEGVKLSQKQFLLQEKAIMETLNQLYRNKIPNSLIQKCLYQLDDNYYSKDGIKIINGCLQTLLQFGSSSLQQSLSVKHIISKLLRNYRQNNIFQELLKRHLIDNNKYIRICGQLNKDLIQDNQFEQKIRMKLKFSQLKDTQLQKIRNYRPSDILQDYRILPKINVNQFQIFEQKNPQIFNINGIPIYHCHKCDGIKITIKYDVTDLNEDQIKMIPIVCQSFPFMGGKAVNLQAFRTHIQMYIKHISMKFDTTKTKQGMKLYLFLIVQFSQRNAQFGFNLLSNIVNNHDHHNIEAISERVQRKASLIYNELSQNLIDMHGRHIGATKSPYAMINDPIFMARSTCQLASNILKISNPKQMLYQVADQISKITSGLSNKNRVSMLFECRKSSVNKYQKYLQMILSPLKFKQLDLSAIDDQNFTPSTCMKYFPNYSQQFVFQAFPVPYYKNQEHAPQLLVLSTIIGKNIKTYNQNGGCFLYKGSMMSYIRGGRKKVLQLQQNYKKIENVDEAKRFIFQKFRRYTPVDLFYTQTNANDARNFKQAVGMVDQKSLHFCLQKYILNEIKAGTSSILAVGPHLGNYEPLIKKGWTIQRSIQQMSLKMESNAPSLPEIQMTKYINIY